LFQSSLIRASAIGGKIYPKFMRVDGSDSELAQAMIDTYLSMVGMRKGMLNGALKELEVGRDYKLVRGLSALLERRCRFTSTGKLDPIQTRALVFTLASGRYLEREKVLREAAARLAVSVQDVEESLWSDLEENMVLEEFDPIDPRSLIRDYNLSLVQTLLLRSASMTFSVSDHWKEIFRTVKQLGLMYIAEAEGDDMVVKVMGPLSLTKLTDRYGSSIAKLFEQIVKCSRWRVSADIVSQTKQRIYKLDLTSEKHGHLMSRGQWDENPFDSEVERKFYDDFKSVNSGWDIVREPGPVKVGTHVFIPDFALKKFNHTIYMEIVGFWTPSYIKAKQEKLRDAKGMDMIIAVDEELGPIVPESDRVITFKRTVPVERVVRYLKEREKELLRETVMSARIKVKPWETVVALDEFAEKNGLKRDVLMEVVNRDGLEGYRVIGDEVISEEYLKNLKGELGDLDGKPYIEVEAVLKKKGLRSYDALLRELGYRVVWKSLDPADAIVKKA